MDVFFRNVMCIKCFIDSYVSTYVVVEIVIVIWFHKALGIHFTSKNIARLIKQDNNISNRIKSNMRHKRKDETRKCFTVKHENA